MRIGIIALQHESNTFIASPATLSDFQRDGLLVGDAVRRGYGDSHHEIGGFFQLLDEAGVEAVPLFAAWALPGGAVDAETYEKLLAMMLDALDGAARLDGLLLAPHGAGVCEAHRDMDGHWLGEVRRRVGPGVPIICTIDPHANVSRAMIDACDATIAYRSNPHLDQRDIGVQAGRLLLRTLRGEVRPTQAHADPAIMINIERQHTTSPPCLPMYERANAQLKLPGVLSNSIVLGFSYADVMEMGSSFIAVTDNDPMLAQRCADELAGYLYDHREAFVAHLTGVDDALTQAMAAEGPVCLLDMGDNVGGGSPADGTHLAAAIHAKKLGPAFVALCDPQAQRQARAAGVGATLTLSMGAKTDRLHGEPIETQVTVARLHDGTFHEPRARHGGKTHYDMGPTAVVETAHGLTVQLTTQRIAPFSLEQLECCGLDPAAFKLLVAKGVQAPVAAYAEVCKTIIRVNTPGCTSADLQSVDYRYRRRPLFPFEDTPSPAASGSG